MKHKHNLDNIYMCKWDNRNEIINFYNNREEKKMMKSQR